MSVPEVVFEETAVQRRVASVPLAHLSVELGHLYMDDFAAGPQALRGHLRRVAPWAHTAQRVCAAAVAGRPRISTCFLVDDYFTEFGSPAEVVPQLVAAAADSDLVIDYLVRESACAQADGVPVAQLVAGRIVAEPTPDTTGNRPPTTEIGWLSNGQRSPTTGSAEAMGQPTLWQGPVQIAARRHSVFVDVELWSDDDGGRTWSCAFLAAVWQLLRLGLLRSGGEPVAVPVDRTADDLPDRWAALPAVTRLNPAAAPFAGYRTFSVLGQRFLATEHAVRVVLQQVAVERAVAEQVAGRAAAEGIDLPDLVDRIGYAFLGD